jgi:hypothetical protein
MAANDWRSHAVSEKYEYYPVDQLHKLLLLCDLSQHPKVPPAVNTWLLHGETVKLHAAAEETLKIEVTSYPGKHALRPGGRHYSHGRMSQRGVQGMKTAIRNFILHK